MNQFILISCVHEIYNFNTSDSLRIISLSFAFCLLFLCLGFIFFVSLLAYSSYEISEKEHNKFGEIFSGITMQKRNKFYVSVLLIRRLTFVILLITVVSIQSWVLVCILSLLQLWYMIYIMIIRPFESRKNNFNEILNEVYFFILLISLIFLNSEKDWSSEVTQIYMWVVCSNSILSFIIILSKQHLLII